MEGKFEIQYLSKTDLIRAKSEAGRPQDLAICYQVGDRFKEAVALEEKALGLKR